MKIDISYKYSESEIPPRCRKPRMVEKQDVVTVSVRELNVGELKPAFVVRDYKKEIVIRSYNERLYKVKTRRNQDGEEEPISTEYFEAFLKGKGTNFWGENAQQDVINTLFEIADKYIISGEIVYEEVGEPRYCIYTFGLGHNHGGTSLSVEFNFNDNISSTRYFDALHYKDAVLAATQIAFARGDDESVEHFYNGWHYIDVIDPNCVNCNPKTHGSGNDVINRLEGIIENSGSQTEAITNIILASMP